MSEEALLQDSVEKASVRAVSASQSLLAQLEDLGEGTLFAQQISAMIGHSRFCADFTSDDIRRIAGFMRIYRARAGHTIIREGDVDDFLLLMIQGQVEIVKTDTHGLMQPMTVVGPGMTLGEMSMIDGEPRFATCVAVEPAVFAVLSRDRMVRIIIEEPALGAKVLIKLVTMLSQRLRQTSSNLLHYMER